VFEWDERKNRNNLEKHGISFEEAKEIFYGPILTRRDTRRDYGETRSVSMGLLAGVVVIVVAHADRKGNVRIISARRAGKKEREVYRAYLKEAFERD
jgi:uncharacterized protein